MKLELITVDENDRTVHVPVAIDPTSGFMVADWSKIHEAEDDMSGYIAPVCIVEIARRRRAFNSEDDC